MRVQCACGEVVGELDVRAPHEVNYIVCRCDDCQAWARWLGCGDVLDEVGGTPIVQVAPSALRFTEGTDRLRSAKLTERGLLRWYADCCRSPLGNQVAGWSPFVGMPARSIDLSGDGAAAVGSVRGRIQGRFATPPVADEHVLAAILQGVRLVACATARGRTTTPFPAGVVPVVVNP